MDLGPLENTVLLTAEPSLQLNKTNPKNILEIKLGQVVSFIRVEESSLNIHVQAPVLSKEP